MGFALETQTRPTYWSVIWAATNGDDVVVHELAHQWYGDHVAIERWQDIWLSEGFATYAEWLWLEHEGQATPRQSFETTYSSYPADDPFWSVAVGDPGPGEHQLDDAVYDRGAMTLQALREAIGDQAFFSLLRRWAERKGGGNGNTGQFIATAERVSGRQLDPLFQAWLFAPTRPALPAPVRSSGNAGEDPQALAWLRAAQARRELGGH